MKNKKPPLLLFMPLIAIALALLSVALLLYYFLSPRGGDSLSYTLGVNEVRITFNGEVSNEQLFGSDGALTDTVRPRSNSGRSEGEYFNRTPNWLSFDYRVNDEQRSLLLAKQPIMNNVSWDGIARAGAALGDSSRVRVGTRSYRQNAHITDRNGNRYRVRLLTCGHSTMAAFSEWNMLIGGVHRGDMDFQGEHYGWIARPYSDAELKVGYKGSLNWCQENWRGSGNRVVRGYFFVSRLHATPTDFTGDRIFWRPVLERIPDDAPNLDEYRWEKQSPDKRVSFFGTTSSAELFGENRPFTDLVPMETGVYVGRGSPDWMRFRYRGKNLLVAAKPVKRSLSWLDIARAGAVLGDGSSVRADGQSYPQTTQVEDLAGNRYRVRLLNCGAGTMDNSSEWNALIGGVHVGDGDFLASPDGLFGWLTTPMTNADLHLGTRRGAANWCQELKTIDGKTHGVNRGYLTVARYHATDYTFRGYGFGWRPVLELIEE